MSGQKKSNQAVFLVVVGLIIFIFSAYLWNKNKTDQDSTKSSIAAEHANFFQKPGAEAESATPSKSTAETQTPAQLEQITKSPESTPATYNLLATAYYQKGDKAQALKTIDDGLVKYPNDDSLLKTKDLIENILPNL